MPVQPVAQIDGGSPFLPAAYDLAWSAVVLLLLAGAVVAVVLGVRLALRRTAAEVHRTAADEDARAGD